MAAMPQGEIMINDNGLESAVSHRDMAVLGTSKGLDSSLNSSLNSPLNSPLNSSLDSTSESPKTLNSLPLSTLDVSSPAAANDSRLSFSLDPLPGIEFAAKPTISVLGLGYVGAVSAACFSDRGHSVIGVDPDAERVATLNR